MKFKRKTHMSNYNPIEAPLLVFPMEIIDRELNGSMLLSYEAVSRGWQCVIGSKKVIYEAVSDLPPSIFFLKSITLSDLNNIKKIKSYGHKVVSLDVEGLVYADLYEFVTVRFHPDTMRETDAIMFWGDVQRQAIVDAYPAFSDKCITTGSPIVDFWKPECGLQSFYDEDVKALKERFGSFVLIPSSFGLPNHKMGKQAATNIIERDEMIPEKEREAFFAHWKSYEQHVENVFERFLNILPALSEAFPDTTFIVRPHPAERHETWIEAAKDYPNIKVIYEGVVSPWLLAAEAVLHWGCTTGVEAFLMGRPVIAYNPISAEEEKYDHKLPHSVSIETRTIEECLSALSDILRNPVNIMDRYPALKAGAEAFDAWSYTPPLNLAANAVMNVLENHKLGAHILSRNMISTQLNYRSYVWSVLEKIDTMFKGKIPFPARIRLSLNSIAYGRQKARNMQLNEVVNVWHKLRALLPQGCDAKITELKKNMHLIAPER